MKTDFKKLAETEHMFKWLAHNPFVEMVTTIEEMFQEQVPTTILKEFAVASEPQWLTGGVEDENNYMKVTRCGVAFLCEFTLVAGERTEYLSGVFSWVGVEMEEGKGQQRTWMDLGGSLADFGSNGRLKERIYFNEPKTLH